jgi:GTPase SAR1 family protein
MSVDIALTKYIAFCQEIGSLIGDKLSESDTRSKIIDKVFTNILGWTEFDLRREGKTDSGYFDYKFKTSFFQFVVEAKKTFVKFDLPKNHKKAQITTLLKGNSEVIEQIRGYLQGEGLTYGVITNGHQYIIGKFINTDGSDWKKNSCVLFDGLPDIKNRFIEFFNTLSKTSILDSRHINFGEELFTEGRTLISSFVDRDKELIRNNLNASLRPLLESIFGEIYKYEVLNNKELIDKCFVRNEEINKNRREIERLFDDSYPELTEVLHIRDTNKISQQISNELSTFPSTDSEHEAPKPIVIIGAKGAGKTTFINYLFKDNLEEDVKRSRPFIYLDFRNYDNMSQYRLSIINDILSQLEDHYEYLNLTEERILKAIYQKDISKLERGLWKIYKRNSPEKYEEKLYEFLETSISNREEHLIKVSEYLIGSRKMRLSIIIDNADQLDMDSQKDVYLFAQSLNRRVKCAVVIALREGYYYKWRSRPPFDAFTNDVYHITAPPYKDVLQRRINYALEKMGVHKAVRGEYADKQFTVTDEKVKDFLLSLSATLFDDKNSEMLRYLEEISYPNIRLGLESFKSFLVSGHINTTKYLMSETSLRIPVWEFVKAIGLENRRFYDHEISVVKNLFYPAEGNTSHFTKIRILRYLFDKTKKDSTAEKFVQASSIYDVFALGGHSFDALKKEIDTLVEYQLIETDNYLSDTDSDSDINGNQNVSISLKGYYYYTELINRWHYLDLVLQDTPIYDPHFFEEIKSKFPKPDASGTRNLDERRKVMESFVEYLRLKEKQESFSPDSKTDTALTYNIVNEMMLSGLKTDFSRLDVELRLSKNLKIRK